MKRRFRRRRLRRKDELKTKVDNLEQAPLGGDGQFDEQGNFVGPKVPNVELPEDKRTGERKGGRGTPETEIGKLALEPQNGAEAPYTAFSGKVPAPP